MIGNGLYYQPKNGSINGGWFMKSTFHPLKKEDSSSEKTEFLEER